MNRVTTIRAFDDNFIYLCEHVGGVVFVVDPGDSTAVFDILKARGLTLSAILLTHHHFDHVQGAGRVKSASGCEVVALRGSRVSGVDRCIGDGETMELGPVRVRLLATPGHTADSVCYYVGPFEGECGMLFTGDTLFTGGCGRLLECDARTMWDSLGKIAALPEDTLVYPGHDYTQENYEFALTIEPGNKAVQGLLGSGDFAPPSTISREKETNIFLRATCGEVKAALAMPDAPDSEVFAELRRRKDIFG
ncbi:MAG: hydroxyacylglutathione hydrolase [Sedimentisphaerales bacterium]|nr:hydroxyacylglutathione hydrolase [Sedimentisphaerales bacterium]